jgi:hypothetical protein
MVPSAATATTGIDDNDVDDMNFTQAMAYLGVTSPSVLYRLFAQYGVSWGRSSLNPRIRTYTVAELDRLREEAGL